MNTVTTDDTVKQYTYRSARVMDVFLNVPRYILSDLECMLAKTANARVDNHVVYAIVQSSKTTYIMFSDLNAYFGLKIQLGSW